MIQYILLTCVFLIENSFFFFLILGSVCGFVSIINFDVLPVFKFYIFLSNERNNGSFDFIYKIECIYASTNVQEWKNMNWSAIYARFDMFETIKWRTVEKRFLILILRCCRFSKEAFQWSFDVLFSSEISLKTMSSFWIFKQALQINIYWQQALIDLLTFKHFFKCLH